MKASATIWKFSLQTKDHQTIQMPRGAQLLTVQAQGGDCPSLWAKVNPLLPKDPRHIRIVGTGHPIDFQGTYLGTYQLAGGALVFHVFEIVNGNGDVCPA